MRGFRGEGGKRRNTFPLRVLKRESSLYLYDSFRSFTGHNPFSKIIFLPTFCLDQALFLLLPVYSLYYVLISTYPTLSGVPVTSYFHESVPVPYVKSIDFRTCNIRNRLL